MTNAITPLEAVGVLVAGAGVVGFVALAVDLWRDRGLPAHTHEEGAAPTDGRPCPRCTLPPRTW